MDAESSAIIVLVTTSTQEEAEKIGRMLIEAKLAACTNIVSGIRSIFRWDNNISVENECLMLIKTTQKRFAELESAVRQQHSYSVPEIVALPVVAGSESYLNWVRGETDK
ncbi:MAG: divalent-cation tolerance protein CutA [Nitrospira sp.]|uniref:Divalent-cation tolerance protein CutA n=1 Tax=Nitrospira defluvii TaxID=330214 RepID=A0ABM8RK55_9BACT|nr:divalent-cation tolerance protein CutA [Nitrospira defluvii]MCS6326113.1 divalent-cation tolerance protein CutA [Nitrospira sp.]CAE6757069.1 Divalent-cation tolerance protein CutA [Nitrospira defluvii]